MTGSDPNRVKQPRDYLIFALDLPTLDEASHYINLLSDSVGMFKVGLELFLKEGRPVIEAIKKASSARIFLDLKLHDIPTTVCRAMKNMADLEVDFTTVHCAGQKDMLSAAVDGAGGKVQVLGVTVLTSLSGDDLRADGLAEQFAQDPALLVKQRAAAAYQCGCHGIVCAPGEATVIKKEGGQKFIAVTPGIRTEASVVQDDQSRVSTPAQAIINGADYLVMGRPLRDAPDPVAAAAAVCREIEAAL